MRNYIQFDLRVRKLIAVKLNAEELSYGKIAEHLGVAKSAVWYEVHRNRVRMSEKVRRAGMLNGRPVRVLAKWFMYDPEYAHQQASKRARTGRIAAAAGIRRLIPGTRLYDTVEGMLTAGRKPDVIAGRLKREHPDDPSMWVSHETIYQHTYNTPSNGWHEYFVKERKKRRPHSTRRSSIPNRVSITHRPQEVWDRSTFGHFEGDTIVGYAGNPSKHVVATLVERKTRKLFARISTNKSSPKTIGVIAEILETITGHAKTVTFDNGTEFANHRLLTTQHNIDVYFADPYSSWQRGTNERHNGLLRRSFPKGTDFAHITPEELQETTNFWNNYPRKILNYLTPNEAWTLETTTPTTLR